jgi:alkanesulfonate monooxygenase SsuD/methylene tetrahydromethanopterin reductase-like flavin-dependent oxidoreductase (luciferase family)
MRFGILLDHQYRKGDDLQRRLPELIEFVQAVRDLGYDSLFGIHHYLSTLATFQPLALLSRLVDHTGSMQIGTGILILPLQHPVHAAEELATLDQLCGGRLVVGVGAGYRENEFRAFGIDRSERLPRMWESLEVLEALWSGGPQTHAGGFYALDGDELSVLPVQRPYPPIWIGSGAPSVVAEIGRRGYPWLTAANAKRNWTLGNLDSYKRELAASGHAATDHEFPIHRELHIGDSPDDAFAEVSEYMWRSYREYAPFGLDYMTSKFEDVARKSGLFGTSEQVSAGIRDYASHGYNHFVFRTQWLDCPLETSLRTLERFAREVMPALRDQPAKIAPSVST